MLALCSLLAGDARRRIVEVDPTRALADRFGFDLGETLRGDPRVLAFTSFSSDSSAGYVVWVLLLLELFA